MNTTKLNSGTSMPALGFGTWKLAGETAYASVVAALDLGYRHIDTADKYGNHREVGRAIAEGGVPRTELFVTTKLWREDLGPAALDAAVSRFLEELGLDHIDQLLIHWPNPEFPAADTLAAMAKWRERGIVRSLGVSNFTVRHLEEALQCGVAIDANQVELHPSLPQSELRSFCAEHGITVVAYTPLAKGHDLEIPLITELAARYGRSPAQVILAWIMAKGMVALTRSSNRERIADNFRAVELILDEADIARIDSLGLPPDRVNHPAYAEFDD